MKAVMLSVRPEWVEKILNGEKTVEIRKTMPRYERSVKVYIYCAKDKKYEIAPFRFTDGWKYKKFDDTTHYCCGCTANMGEVANGKVVAEFILKHHNKFNIEGAEWYDMLDLILEKSCLTKEQLERYLGSKTKIAYNWHIRDLKVYDKPKELSEFQKICQDPQVDCANCGEAKLKHNSQFDDGVVIGCNNVLTRAPQNWCYVEAMNEA